MLQRQVAKGHNLGEILHNNISIGKQLNMQMIAYEVVVNCNSYQFEIFVRM